ncbi:MAG: hypothetical protein DRI84_06350 [Bacteroidetes bacterium]|nr:MAG: hypothetical protein DRI84_06350 [Bacteroidota bacterium]
MLDIEKDLRNLAIQATTDRSHYYVRSTAMAAAAEIGKLERKSEAINLLYMSTRMENIKLRELLRKACTIADGSRLNFIRRPDIKEILEEKN